MQQSHLCGNALVRVKSNKASQQVKFALSYASFGMLFKWDATEFRESLFHITKFQGVGPVCLVGRAEYTEYFEDLVDFTVAHK